MADIKNIIARNKDAEFVKVYNIFNDFFGEDYVDIQVTQGTENFSTTDRLYDIIVYWPEVTITNEYGSSIRITDLYAKTTIHRDGRIKYSFRLIRSSFTREQAAVRYTHSHVSATHFLEWAYPCLGSGPINETISTLRNNFDEYIWNLYCRELSEYVQIESVSGVPYIRMNNVTNQTGSKIKLWKVLYCGTCQNVSFYSPSVTIDSNDAVKYIVRNTPFKFVYSTETHTFTFANSSYDLILLTSNAFIKYCSEKEITLNTLLNTSFIKKALSINHVLYNYRTSSSYGYTEIEEHRLLLTFKGKEIRSSYSDNTSDNQLLYVLNEEIISRILLLVAAFINATYKNTKVYGRNIKVI